MYQVFLILNNRILIEKPLILQYKRIAYFNEMSSQSAYITRMYQKRKNETEIILGLIFNFLSFNRRSKTKDSRMAQSNSNQTHR